MTNKKKKFIRIRRTRGKMEKKEKKLKQKK